MNILFLLLILQMDGASPSSAFADIDPVAKEAASIQGENERRSRIFSVLPHFIDKTPELHYLLNELQLHTLESTYCGDLTKIALQIERFDESHPRVGEPPGIGRYMPPDDRIKQRIAELALPDTQAFYLDASNKPSLGRPSDFWPDLFKWAAKNRLESPVLTEIKTAFNDFKAQQGTHSPKETSEPVAVQPSNQIKPSDKSTQILTAKPKVAQETGNSPTRTGWLLWGILGTLALVITILLWWLPKKNSGDRHKL